MLCDNCGKKEANVRYYTNINGVEKQMNLCEECSQKLGVTDFSFDMPIDFSSFFSDFLEDFSNSSFLKMPEELRCKGCNSTFEEIAREGKFKCPKCYETFEDKIDLIMNKIHGSNRHIGRIGKITNDEVQNVENVKQTKIENEKSNNKIENLKNKLKDLVKEEKYEEAAKVRDEIKKLEKEEK